jgi:hypothetical protein
LEILAITLIEFEVSKEFSHVSNLFSSVRDENPVFCRNLNYWNIHTYERVTSGKGDKW